MLSVGVAAAISTAVSAAVVYQTRRDVDGTDDFARASELASRDSRARTATMIGAGVAILTGGAGLWLSLGDHTRIAPLQSADANGLMLRGWW